MVGRGRGRARRGVRLAGATARPAGPPPERHLGARRRSDRRGRARHRRPDAVVLGFPEQGQLRSFPRDSVESVDIGDPLDRRSPPPSLLARVAGLNAWAATPLELWCGGESYAWTRLGDQCQTQPEILPHTGNYAGGELRVRVACPEEADPGCSGFLIVTTVRDFAVDGLGAPLELGRTIFQAQGVAPSRRRSGSTTPSATAC